MPEWMYFLIGFVAGVAFYIALKSLSSTAREEDHKDHAHLKGSKYDGF